MGNSEKGTTNLEQNILEQGKIAWQNYLNSNGLSEVPAAAIDATTVCDWGECPACYFMEDEGKRLPKQHIKSSTVQSWIKIFQESNVIPEQIWIAGGEPTLNQDLPEIIKTLKKGGVPYIALITNGFNLNDPDYVKTILNSGVDEIAITVNGANSNVHNLMTAPNHHPAWVGIPDGRLEELIQEDRLPFVDMNNFDRAYAGLLTVCQQSVETGTQVTVGINLNMNQAADLESLVNKIIEDGGRLDTVWLQSMQDSTRATFTEAGNRSFEWQKPTKDMVKAYLEQSKRLLQEGKIKFAAIIDPLPEDIVHDLDLHNNPAYQDLEGNPIYQPSDTPSVGVTGTFRENVLK